MLTGLLNALSTMTSATVAKPSARADFGQNDGVMVTIANLNGAH